MPFVVRIEKAAWVVKDLPNKGLSFRVYYRPLASSSSALKQGLFFR